MHWGIDIHVIVAEVGHGENDKRDGLEGRELTKKVLSEVSWMMPLISRTTRRRVDEIELVELSDAQLSDPKSARRPRSHPTPSPTPLEQGRLPTSSSSAHKPTSTVNKSGFLEATLAYHSLGRCDHSNHAR